MHNAMTCGEATIRLLGRYGVDTVFGIPGVHTLDFCRGLADGAQQGALRHVQTRNEQGAGFMAEGWARATGEVGVALVISGPGVTNAATALGQCYADSLPLLLRAAEAMGEPATDEAHKKDGNNQSTKPEPERTNSPFIPSGSHLSASRAYGSRCPCLYCIFARPH